ncbi:MAG TPA: hypothetical protein VD927_12480 [Chryseosolibacter sp.]|nr:hypothetical protein [Chryseosolibacter sp.]
MFKKLFVVSLLTTIATCAVGQDTTFDKSHFVGVQANQLFKQLFNLSNAPVASNPYLFNYSFNSAGGAGLNVGFGYEFEEFKTGDPINQRETDLNNFFFRIGPEKKHLIGHRWMLSAGFDVLYQRESNITTNSSDTENFKTWVQTDNIVKTWGFGPRFSLLFSITKTIVVGTELTYYFKKSKNESRLESSTTSREFNESGQLVFVTRTEEDETDNTTKQLQFESPAVLFLFMRLY